MASVSTESEGDEGNREDKLSGWDLLRSKLQKSSKYSTALENFKGNLKEKLKPNEQQLFNMGSLGESGGLMGHLKGLNNAVLGLPEFKGSESFCNCNNTCGAQSDGVCSCNCSNCFHSRPENVVQASPQPEHFSIIRHASLFQC